MHCARASQLLQLYLDYQLSLEQLRELETHLSECSSCHQDLWLLEDVTGSLQAMHMVKEPEDLTLRIMQRVAMTNQQQNEREFSLFRPSLAEVLTIILLASIVTFAAILEQPSLRSAFPIMDIISQSITSSFHLFMSMDSGVLTWVLWVGGTFIGICITLALAGNEVRTEWYETVVEWLPVR